MSGKGEQIILNSTSTTTIEMGIRPNTSLPVAITVGTNAQLVPGGNCRFSVTHLLPVGVSSRY
jgi:hypothetical protein